MINADIMKRISIESEEDLEIEEEFFNDILYNIILEQALEGFTKVRYVSYLDENRTSTILKKVVYRLRSLGYSVEVTLGKDNCFTMIMEWSR